MHYTIDTRNIVHETIEGEAILINMTTGSYYSLEGSGAAIWEFLQPGPVAAGSLAAFLATRYETDDVTALAESTRMLSEMAAEGLLLTTDAPEAPRPTPAQTSRQPFELPTLQKYTDLEALLLLDPIHDVSDQNWPNPKTDA
jgi:hypothetical protein